MTSLNFWWPFQRLLPRRYGGAPAPYLESTVPTAARQTGVSVGTAGCVCLTYRVVHYLFDHHLPPALSPPDCHRYGKKKVRSRQARSSPRSEWLLSQAKFWLGDWQSRPYPGKTARTSFRAVFRSNLKQVMTYNATDPYVYLFFGLVGKEYLVEMYPMD